MTQPRTFRRSRRGRLGATVVVVLVAGIAALLGALPAAAHDTLTGSDPADRSTLTSAPTSVTLTFNDVVQNYQPVLVVTGPNTHRYSTGAPSVAGNTVRIAVDGAGPAGTYTVAYRIVSADGHPVSGQLSYTLAAAAAGTYAGTPAESPATAGASGGLGGWLWVALGAAALMVAVAVIIVLRRPTRPRLTP